MAHVLGIKSLMVDIGLCPIWASVSHAAVDIGDSAHVLCIEGGFWITCYMYHFCKEGPNCFPKRLYQLTSPYEGPPRMLTILPAIRLSWLLDDNILCGCISLMTNDSELISAAY